MGRSEEGEDAFVLACSWRCLLDSILLTPRLSHSSARILLCFISVGNSISQAQTRSLIPDLKPQRPRAAGQTSA